MSRKNDDLKKTYEKYQETADNTLTPDVSEKQALPKKKLKEKLAATIAVFLVGATLIGVGIKFKNKGTDPTPTPETTSSYDDGSDDEEKENYEYVLVEDFDINDSTALSKVVSDIKAIVGDDYDIENIIKYFNGVLQKSDFSDDMSDDEIFEEMQKYGPQLYEILSNLVADYVNAIENLEAEKASGLASDISKLVSAASIISNDDSARAYGIRLADILESLLKGVNDGDISSRDKLANEFYNLSNEINNDEALDIYTKTILRESMYVALPLFSGSLTEEKITELEKANYTSSEKNQIGYGYMGDFGLDYLYIVSENDDGNMGRDLTPTTEVYNSSDVSDANNYAGSTGEETSSEIVSQGGNSVSSEGSSEVVSEATTTVSQSTTVVEVPSTETTTKTEQGGQVVGTTSVVTETTTVISEEIVSPGTEEETVEEATEEYTNSTSSSLSNVLTTLGWVTVLGSSALGSLNVVRYHDSKNASKTNSGVSKTMNKKRK